MGNLKNKTMNKLGLILAVVFIGIGICWYLIKVLFHTMTFLFDLGVVVAVIFVAWALIKNQFKDKKKSEK